MRAVIGLFEHISDVDRLVQQYQNKDKTYRQYLGIVVQTDRLNTYVSNLRYLNLNRQSAATIPKLALTPTLSLLVGNPSVETKDVGLISIRGRVRGYLYVNRRKSLRQALKLYRVTDKKIDVCIDTIVQGGVLVFIDKKGIVELAKSIFTNNRAKEIIISNENHVQAPIHKLSI